MFQRIKLCQILFGAVVLILIRAPFDAQAVRACSVRLYKTANFEGTNYVQWTKPSGTCVNIRKDWRRKTVSIDTFDICVVLWSKSTCRGKALRLQRYDYGTSDLRQVNYGAKASSIQTCKGTDIPDANAGPPPHGFDDNVM